MSDVTLQVGDIIFKDSEKGGAKMVKFLMTAPNVWVHIWRAIRGTQETVQYYHPGMVTEKEGKLIVIEQQWEVEYKDLNKMIGGDSPMLIARRKNLTVSDLDNLKHIAESELGQKWGVVHTLFGRFITWLTAIPYFARYVKLPNEEVSAGRVARWYAKAFGEHWGHKRYTEATTHTMVKKLLSSPDEYVILKVRG